MATQKFPVQQANASYPDNQFIEIEDAHFQNIANELNAIPLGGGGGGGLTSVGIVAGASMPYLTVANSPLVANGDITLEVAPQLASQVLIAPSAGAGVPTFRVLTGADLPLATATDPGAIPALSGVATQYLNGAGAWTTPAGGGGGLTSVGIVAPSIIAVTGSPLTANGDITLTLASEPANTVFAGPDGATGIPTFRSLVGNDIPLATLTGRGAIPALSGSSGQYLAGNGTWTNLPSAGGDTVVTLADADAPGFTLSDGATSFHTTSTTPTFVDIPNILFNLDGQSYYEINFYAIASCASPTEGIQFKVLTDGTEYHFNGQLRTNTNTASTSVNLLLNLAAAPGETPLVSSTPNQEYYVEIRVLIRTNTAQTVKFQMAMETGTYTGYLWHPTFARARKIKSDPAWL